MKTIFIVTLLTGTFMHAMEQESVIEAQRARGMSQIARQYKVHEFASKAENFIRKKAPINKDTFLEFFGITDVSLGGLENAGLPETDLEIEILKNRLLLLSEKNDPQILQRIIKFLATIEALVEEAGGEPSFVEEFVDKYQSALK